MIWAALNDLFQRVLTLNKREQRVNLERHLDSLALPERANVLDFGCGTGLFATAFTKHGLRYLGYDICSDLTDYASRLYRNVRFTASRQVVTESGPYDLIVANCCFHHIDTETVLEELASLARLLAPDGKFMLIDILLPKDDPSCMRRWFRKLERGMFIRSEDDYGAIVRSCLSATETMRERSHVFSLPGNPVYNDLVIIIAKRMEPRAD